VAVPYDSAIARELTDLGCMTACEVNRCQYCAPYDVILGRIIGREETVAYITDEPLTERVNSVPEAALIRYSQRFNLVGGIN
jgi:hypothetical protein